ncbi:Envelope glycoprotein [Marasmius tenuissimus]|nr:Envelope glycoprotein [Marasmius tenuissimus]
MNSTASAPLDHSEDAHYGYRPLLYVCVIYIALFSTTLGIHIQQMFSSRSWFMGPTVVLAASLEVAGWAGRLWSNQDLPNGDPFMLQICTLILGPTPLLAANFVIFGRLVSLLGVHFSRLRPNLYAYIFLGCDVISLILQGAGGGIASSADPGTSGLDLGTNLMISGIALQVAMMTVFVILVGEFIFRYINDKPLRKKATMDRFPLDTRRQVLLLAMGITTGLLFIRGVYRLIELSDGWDSEIMRTEWLFNVFDGAMIVLALFTWNVAHPAVLLRTRPSHVSDATMEKPQSTQTDGRLR